MGIHAFRREEEYVGKRVMLMDRGAEEENERKTEAEMVE